MSARSCASRACHSIRVVVKRATPTTIGSDRDRTKNLFVQLATRFEKLESFVPVAITSPLDSYQVIEARVKGKRYLNWHHLAYFSTSVHTSSYIATLKFSPTSVFSPEKLAGSSIQRVDGEELTHRLAIGIRQPVPKARSVIFNPGGACLRLNSERATIRTTLSTTAGS